ncbi:sugar-transfer associated ATP-grasp domain-containing protein [Bacteroides uniformis]
MPISTEEAVKLVLATDLDCIIKPSIDSGSGKNVKLVRKEEIDTAKVKDLFETYKWDFNIQKRLEQSATLKKLNESSLNTLRIYTYRTLAGEYVLLVSVVRFGGKGAFNDNASTGGGFCHVYDDGSLDQRVLRYHTLDKPTLKEFLGFESLTIPNYDRVMKFVFDLHRRLPYFDLVGWDIALDVNNEPVFIEMNLTAESGFAQMNGGPLFGKYLDEVMERVSKVHKDYRNSVEMKFENGSRLMMKV